MIGGVIAVRFPPLVMVMYFLIALLEDCGYMSRVAVVLDPIFKRSVFPANRSFLLLLPSVVPFRYYGEPYHTHERERRATAQLAPLCHAVQSSCYCTLCRSILDNAWWVSALMYL